jgi:glutamate--cysteine ligase
VNDPYPDYDERLTRLARAPLGDCLRDNFVGLEKESLRVSPAGTIASTPHPAALGSALTHPFITTDFSEALLEVITPAMTDKQEILGFLRDLHVFVYSHLGEELLWATSMPCILEGAGNIPLARYGSSNAARMKTVYRRGLGNRYGRAMQVIAGVHYNFSFSDAFWPLYRDLEAGGAEPGHFRSEAYMALIRNLQRFGWLVPYLFGASPAVCKTFVQRRQTDLDELDRSTYYCPHGTSLRMGDIGYQNRQTAGTGMKASYDNLDAYVRTLTWAIETSCPHYEAIGVRVGEHYEQLNANVLQIENEYYSTVRPKQLSEWMEKPSLALRRRGVRYVELRSLDVNAFHPLGVAEEQLEFMEAFMLFCLLMESPRIGTGERKAIDENLLLVAHRGRDPSLELDRNGSGVRLRQWAAEVLDAMAPAAELIDGGSGGRCADSLSLQLEKVRDPELTPSARMLAEMRANSESFFEYARRTSHGYRDRFRGLSLSAEREALFKRLSRESWKRQRELELSDDIGFDEFLAQYFAQRDPAQGALRDSETV